MLPEEEVWKPVHKYPDYLASSWGRVMRCTKGQGARPFRVYKPVLHKSGYLRVTLKGGIKRAVHVLVADAFLGAKKDGMQVNHKNLNKTDNRISNLEYLTPRENTMHAVMNRDVFHKLSKEMVLEIRNLICVDPKKKNNFRDLARMYNVTISTIWQIYKRQTWAFLPESDSSL